MTKSRRSKLLYQRRLRNRCRVLKVCVNGEHHGAATHGVRCERCDSVWQRSK